MEKGKLYLVATPIGNLGDITFRAIETLKNVDLILAEDTRKTIKLLNHFEISKQMISFYRHNEGTKIDSVIELLLEGKNLALVSDAGTPAISDPGEDLVREAINNDIVVIPIPGACAAINSLICSGLDTRQFLFVGFLSAKAKEKKDKLNELKNVQSTLIFYEAPHRIVDMVNNMKEIFGDRNISISREISKKYEEIYRGKISEVLNEIENIKGEIVVVVEGNHELENFDDIDVIEHVNMFIDDGLSQMEAIKKVAKLRNVPKSEIYNKFHR